MFREQQAHGVAQAFIRVLDSSNECAQDDNVRCETLRAILSLALPVPSQRDRFPRLRYSLEPYVVSKLVSSVRRIPVPGTRLIRVF